MISGSFSTALGLVVRPVLVKSGGLYEEPSVIVVGFGHVAAFSLFFVAEFGFKYTQILFRIH